MDYFLHLIIYLGEKFFFKWGREDFGGFLCQVVVFVRPGLDSQLKSGGWFLDPPSLKPTRKNHLYVFLVYF